MPVDSDGVSTLGDINRTEQQGEHRSCFKMRAAYSNHRPLRPQQVTATNNDGFRRPVIAV